MAMIPAQLASWLTVAKQGRVVWSGSADEARKSLRRIERAYLGQDVTSASL